MPYFPPSSATSTISFSATTSVTAATTATPFVFTVEANDSANAYDNTTGIFTVPAGKAGLYMVGWSVYTGGTFLARLYVNGTFTVNGVQGNVNSVSQGTAMVVLAVGDTLDIRPDSNQTAAGGSTNQRFFAYKY